jgi:hypothetical protein
MLQRIPNEIKKPIELSKAIVYRFEMLQQGQSGVSIPLYPWYWPSVPVAVPSAVPRLAFSFLCLHEKKKN